jgi:hypothetical protein
LSTDHGSILLTSSRARRALAFGAGFTSAGRLLAGRWARFGDVPGRCGGRAGALTLGPDEGLGFELLVLNRYLH